jgi:hypothetical protein
MGRRCSLAVRDTRAHIFWRYGVVRLVRISSHKAPDPEDLYQGESFRCCMDERTFYRDGFLIRSCRPDIEESCPSTRARVLGSAQ